ncbi:MAG: hypothetical protein ACXU8U_06385 [Asticcacaulis sp.]
MKTLFGVFLVSAGALCAGATHAEADLFSAQTIHAWADVRAVTADGETGWLDGGFGKLRYGHKSKFDLAQAAVQWTPRFTDTLSAYVLVQDVPDIGRPLGVEEAYVKWKPLPVMTPAGPLHFTLRAGQMYPPVSMEHDGTGWTPSRSLTPSAINSWIGEEVLVTGLEGSVTAQAGDHTIGATAAVFSRDDTAGTILAWRGWALHDIATGENTGLPLPSGPQGYDAIFGPYQADVSRPFDEVDGRLGYYVRLDWRPPSAAAFNLEFYDNQGDPSAVRNAQWGWATRFWNIGAQYRLNDKDVVLSQYMTGGTNMGWQIGKGLYVIDADFDSAYLMLSHDLAEGAKLSGRLDYFAVKDNSMRSVDDNTEKGYAATVAWMKPLTSHLDLAVEGLRVISNRPARVTQSLNPRQAQTQVQVALKLHL